MFRATCVFQPTLDVTGPEAEFGREDREDEKGRDRRSPASMLVFRVRAANGCDPELDGAAVLVTAGGEFRSHRARGGTPGARDVVRTPAVCRRDAVPCHRHSFWQRLSRGLRPALDNRRRDPEDVRDQRAVRYSGRRSGGVVQFRRLDSDHTRRPARVPDGRTDTLGLDAQLGSGHSGSRERRRGAPRSRRRHHRAGRWTGNGGHLRRHQRLLLAAGNRQQPERTSG